MWWWLQWTSTAFPAGMLPGEQASWCLLQYLNLTKLRARHASLFRSKRPATCNLLCQNRHRRPSTALSVSDRAAVVCRVSCLAALACVLLGAHHWALAAGAVLWAVVVAVSRAAMGRHYLGDVTAGLLLGLVTAATVTRVGTAAAAAATVQCQSCKERFRLHYFSHEGLQCALMTDSFPLSS